MPERGKPDEISESDYRKISAKIRTAESLTDLEFTSYERTYQVQHMALSGVELIGYMADPFADIKGCEKHLEGMFMRNQLSEVHIRIFKELPKYLNRLDELEKRLSASAVQTGKIVEIPVCYGGVYGEDLPFVAKQRGSKHFYLRSVYKEKSGCVQ